MTRHKTHILLLVFACAAMFARADDSMNLSTNMVPPPAAAEEILKLTSHEANLRLGAADLFPHAGASVTYDDNLLISSTNPLSVVEYTVSPGLTVALGDVSDDLVGPVTIDRIRNLLYYSLADESSKPRRFLGVDYTPSLNFYAGHDQYNNVDHAVQLSGGYNFSRLTSELDFDMHRGQMKDNGVGDLITLANYSAALRNRYDLSERSSLEVNGDYLRYDYIQPVFQGFQDFRNTDWFNHQLGEKLYGSVGMAFGYLVPSASQNQTYEQALLRGTYRLTGKLFFSASGGVEWREFQAGAPTSLNPVFSISGIYNPRETTTVTLEAHRLEEASPFDDYNYTQLGFSGGLRQMLFNRFYAGVRAAYDNLQYTQTLTGNNTVRADNIFSAQLNADYELNPHWTASLFYTYQQNASDVPIYSFGNNLVGARVVWRY